jgi:cell division protein FtsB
LNEMDISEKIRSVLKRNTRVLLGVLVLVLVVHDVFGTHGYLAMRRTENEIKKVQADLEQLNKQNLDLAQEVKELKTDPRIIERIAREELGLAKDGEYIIKIPVSLQLPQNSTRKP